MTLLTGLAPYSGSNPNSESLFNASSVIDISMSLFFNLLDSFLN